MAYGRFPKVESVENRKAKANKTMNQLKVKYNLEPVILTGRLIAKSWWGKAWNTNLESYADFQNRIARGKTYVRSNAVIDLKIFEGLIQAKVKGSRIKPYSVQIEINPLNQDKWKGVTDLCNHRIASLEELVEGRFPQELESLLCDSKLGLFPHPNEIHFSCSCPDVAYMCKHVAAVLYGVGNRLDDNPMLFFELRALNGQELVKKSMDLKIDSMLKNAEKISNRQVKEDDIFNLFGI